MATLSPHLALDNHTRFNLLFIHKKKLFSPFFKDECGVIQRGFVISFSMQISVYTDGGSRGNPGISGFGIVIYDEKNQIIHKISKFIGIKTNNEAEYSALLEALVWIRDHQTGFTLVKFYSDSQLLVRQINGQYKIKAANIKPLYQLALSVIADIHIPCTFHEILREKNNLADELANRAMDRKI